MELTIAHLYPDAMSLYGEYANITVLRRKLEALGVEAAVREITFEDAADLSGADFIYMGAGTERRQKAVLNAAASLGARLKAAVEDGAVLLFTGNAMETLGASVTDAAGKDWPGYGLAGPRGCGSGILPLGRARCGVYEQVQRHTRHHLAGVQ